MAQQRQAEPLKASAISIFPSVWDVPTALSPQFAYGLLQLALTSFLVKPSWRASVAWLTFTIMSSTHSAFNPAARREDLLAHDPDLRVEHRHERELIRLHGYCPDHSCPCRSIGRKTQGKHSGRLQKFLKRLLLSKTFPQNREENESSTFSTRVTNNCYSPSAQATRALNQFD